MKGFLVLLLSCFLLYGCSLPSPDAGSSSGPATSSSVGTTTATATASSTATTSSTSTGTHVGASPAKLLVGKRRAIDYVGAKPQSFYDGLKKEGVQTVIRYCDWKNESISGKTPTPQELADIKRNGFHFVCVFQHNNRWARTDGTLYNTFNAARGKIDANRSLELYAQWGAPRGAAIYMGVDFDSYTSEQRRLVKEYFKAAAPLIRAKGFRVGMYGSGGSCNDLIGEGLIDRSKTGTPLCWIAASSYGWRGTKDMIATRKGYVLAQTVNQTFQGKSVDWDEVLDADFGAWELP